MHGIITTELLTQFNSHYATNIFMEKELILLFKHLSIIAEVRKGKLMMPSLLKVEEKPPGMNDSTVENVVPRLFFYFGPKLGVFCFLLTSLITKARWELLMEDGHPIQVLRNCVQFAIPGKHPGCVTVTDSLSTYFTVSVTLPSTICLEKAHEIYEEVCSVVHDAILTGIHDASHKLNYTTTDHDSMPEVAFACPEHQATPLHPATISSSGLLTCTTHPGSVCSRITPAHRLWLRETATSCKRKFSCIWSSDYSRR